MKPRREMLHYNQKLTYTKVTGKPKGTFRLKMVGMAKKPTNKPGNTNIESILTELLHLGKLLPVS